MTVLGIDFGGARVGFSVSTSGILASPLENFVTKSMRMTVDRADFLIKSHGVELVVIGLPLAFDGSEGAAAEKVRAFGSVLERVSGKRVEYFDERLTSVEADEILKSAGYKGERKKRNLDTAAAVLILQAYLDSQNKRR